MKRIILGVLVAAATAAAQQVTQQVTEQVIQLQDKLQFEASGALPGPAPMIARFGGTSTVVKGAPYSAEATTETVQVLADGNHISNKSSNKSYRDSEGRTRVEIVPGPAGAWMPDTKPFSVTVIDDPVSGDHITLNNNNKQATRFSFKGMNAAATVVAGATGRERNLTMVMRTSSDSAPPPPPPLHVMEAHATTGYVQAGASTDVHVSVNGNAFFASDIKLDMKKESLGKQAIEGVECTGTKETATIPAGAVGNERAIETVTERWYSPELQLEIMTKTTDPRFGETTYRLGNIVRAEQPKSLFEVPADYKLEEPAVNVKVMKSDVK
jgi:hypothetical protein